MVTAGEKRFPVLSKLALALCTIYNSLSETERDFSLQNLIHTDSKRNAMSQEKLQSHLCIKSHASHLSKHCMRCQDSMGKKSKEEKQGRHQTQHCHCSFMIPDEELLASLPYQDWNKKTEACKSKNSFEAEELKKRRKEDEKKADEDLKREVRKLKRKAQEIQVMKVKLQKGVCGKSTEKDTETNNNSKEIKKKNKRVPVKMAKTQSIEERTARMT